MPDLESFPFPPCPRGRPADAYARRLAHEPAGRVRLPSGDEVVLTMRHDDTLAVLSDARFTRELFYEGAPRLYEGFSFSDIPGLLISTDPPRHTRLRRLLAGAFTPRRIEQWRPRVRAVADELLAGLPGEFDFVSGFAFPLPVQVICEVMGVPGIDTERVASWAEAMLSTSGLPLEEKLTAGAGFHAYVAGLIEEHRADPGDGMLAVLVHARDEEDRLTEEELVVQTMGLLLGGYETTGSVLSRSAQRLLDPRPEGYGRLAADPSLVPAAVEELLRLEFPGDTTPIRVALEDVELPSGAVIAKGQGVIASFIGANHDPAVFPDPAAFRLDRPMPSPHLGFSRGIHYCLGANLARMELQEALSALVTGLPELRLAVPADELDWTTGTMAHRPARLPVVKDGR
ncbi:cytochrome P450 [Nonomuraea sp. NPDC050310]|uniref:cytochrome P450 n=1 Tax=unclassified Nonomuraea TaxID=2593643 RepID=UPI003410C898